MAAGKTFLVGIGGASSSGKTTVARLVNSLLPDSVLMHQDDFYLPDDKIPYDEGRGSSNWDCAEAIDFARLIDVLRKIKADSEYVYQVNSLELDDHKEFSLNTNFVESMRRDIRQKDLSGVKIVILDGFLLFNNQQVMDLLDAKIFFTTRYQTLKDRRAARQGYNTVAGFWVDPPSYFDDFVWPEYFKNHADLFKQPESGSLEEHVKATGGEMGPKAKANGIVGFQNEDESDIDQLVKGLVEVILAKVGQT